MRFLILITALLIANVYCDIYGKPYDSNSKESDSHDINSYGSDSHGSGLYMSDSHGSDSRGSISREKPSYGIDSSASYSSESEHQSVSNEKPYKIKPHYREPVVYPPHDRKSHEIKDSHEREPKRYNIIMRERPSHEVKDYFKPVYPIRQNVYAHNDKPYNVQKYAQPKVKDDYVRSPLYNKIIEKYNSVKVYWSL